MERLFFNECQIKRGPIYDIDDDVCIYSLNNAATCSSDTALVGNGHEAPHSEKASTTCGANWLKKLRLSTRTRTHTPTHTHTHQTTHTRAHTHTLMEMRTDWMRFATRHPGYPILDQIKRKPKKPGGPQTEAEADCEATNDDVARRSAVHKKS